MYVPSFQLRSIACLNVYIQKWRMKFFEYNLLDLGAVTDGPAVNVKRDPCQENGRDKRANEVQGQREKYATKEAPKKSNGHKIRYDGDAHNCSGLVEEHSIPKATVSSASLHPSVL